MLIETHIICKSTQFKNNLYYGMFSNTSGDLIIYVGYNEMKKLYVFSQAYDEATIEPFQTWLLENNFKVMTKEDLLYDVIRDTAVQQYSENPNVFNQNQMAMLTALLLVDDANKEVQLHETTGKMATAVCLSNEGMADYFDKGVEYKLVSDGKSSGENFIIVEDALGNERRVFKDRFKIKE